MKTLKLTVKERVIFEEILPQQGRKIEMILCNDLLKKIEFSPEEISRYKLTDQGGGRVVWDQDKEQDKEIEITEEQVSLLKKAASEIDETGKATRFNVSLLAKIDDL